ncbi:MAG: efflux RND transporter periplasmic adaptor subunit [Spirochaetaceae bacterium]|nr:efflux RND transporter periplasmic adaptor subunit [Spirochaetaceae bacterium]
MVMNSGYIKKLAIAAMILGFLAFTGCGAKKSGPRGPRSYEFTEVRRRTLERTVSSSGTIHPVSTVNVLPRMSGKVEKINVDYNDSVRKGDILAELNTDVLRLKREQQYASVIKARASYELQRINYRNQQMLAEKNLISEYELRTSKTTLDGQAADLAVAEANLKEIETEINQYAYITSPIDGIVLDRNITVGDTVVDSSSNNSSKIFVLAENLNEMQIEALVGELDITSIHKGQAVKFSLESLPGRAFTGEVETLRMVPVVSNNVVSYTVIIKVENHDGALMPGMTCAVDFIVERSDNVPAVSNAALRYQPTGLSAEQIADMVFIAGLSGMDEEQRQAALEAREQAKAQGAAQSGNAASSTGLAGLVMGGGQGNFDMRGPGGQRRPGGQGQSGGQAGQGRGGSRAIIMRNLWFINGDGKLDVIRVQTGISNGTLTEIITEDDLEGRQFILREKI